MFHIFLASDNELNKYLNLGYMIQLSRKTKIPLESGWRRS
jgi:hypothetical protein